MKRLLVFATVIAITTGAYAFTWPNHFTYDGLIVKDRGGLPMPSNSIHINGGFFYYGMLNEHYNNDGDSADDGYSSYALGFPVDLGYTFNGKLEVAATLQLIRLSVSNGTDRSEFGLGDVWIKGRALFQPGESFYVGPRIAGKFQGGNSHLGLGDGWGDLDAGMVFAKYDDSSFKLNGSAGFRYSFEDRDYDPPYQPGVKIYSFLEPGFSVGSKFTIYVPVGFEYHADTKRGDISRYAGYGLTLGAKPSFALSDNHTLNFTLLYPITGKNANQEVYLAFTTDSFIPLPSGPGDRDGDGITDDVDNCPNDPEDFDGFEDSDGCPDPDNDGDGILDADDRCPNDPEIFNGYEDEDGCPDEMAVPEPPKFDGTIRFYPDSTEPLDGYYTVMDEAGAKLKEAPDVHITLAGYAADTGRPDFEMKLSEGRAMFVKDYHVNKHGIDANRISIVYFGSTKPIADNSTEEGRNQNRRVVYGTEK